MRCSRDKKITRSMGGKFLDWMFSGNEEPDFDLLTRHMKGIIENGVDDNGAAILLALEPYFDECMASFPRDSKI